MLFMKYLSFKLVQQLYGMNEKIFSFHLLIYITYDKFRKCNRNVFRKCIKLCIATYYFTPFFIL